jgi:hypothetical protein
MKPDLTKPRAVDELISMDPAYDARMGALWMRGLFECGAPA